jgi:hypothetical protein
MDCDRLQGAESMSIGKCREIWISRVEAAERLGCPANQVPRLAAQGFISTRRLPGCDPKYGLEDIERLCRASTTKALPA